MSLLEWYTWVPVPNICENNATAMHRREITLVFVRNVRDVHISSLLNKLGIKINHIKADFKRFSSNFAIAF